MSVDITRAPYRQSGNVVRDSLTETRLWVIWLYKKMDFQALFKFVVKCWRAPYISRETVPGSLGCDGERALAAFQTSARDKQCAMSSSPQWRPRTNWSDGNAKFSDITLINHKSLTDTEPVVARMAWVKISHWQISRCMDCFVSRTYIAQLYSIYIQYTIYCTLINMSNKSVYYLGRFYFFDVSVAPSLPIPTQMCRDLWYSNNTWLYSA